MRDVPFDPTGMEVWTFADRVASVPGPMAARVRELVEKLPMFQRAVVNAVFYERLTKREVARRLNTYPLAVDRALERALRTIGEALGEAL